MIETLDDLLTNLPGEAAPAGLRTRILARLQAERVGERRRARWLDLASIATAALGAVAIWPSLSSLGRLVPSAPVEAFLAWLARAGGSPSEAVWQSLEGAVEWPSGVAEVLGGGGLLALSMMVVPLFSVLRRLMPYREGAAV